MREKKTVLSEALAKRIIEAVGGTVNHNINIMNDQGVIIASRDSARVGRFHEVAYQILNGTEDMVEAYETDHLLGTRRGINVAIKRGGEKIGVLGITGHPDEIRPLVLVMKLAVETMLEYELDQQDYVLRYTQRQQMEASLVHGTFAEDNQLERWAKALSLQTGIYRIPLLFRLEKSPTSGQRQMLTTLLQEAPQQNGQDIVTDWYGKEMIVFKAVEQPVHQVEAGEQLRAFAAPFLEACAQHGLNAICSTGVYCNKLASYHRSLQRAQWLMNLQQASKESFRYFYEYIRPWVDSRVPVTELRDTFDFFVMDDYSETFIRRMLMACQALRKSDYNFVKASQLLFIHKNTLFTWMNDIRQKLHIDPVQSETDRAFWEYLCLYYEHRNND